MATSPNSPSGSNPPFRSSLSPEPWPRQPGNPAWPRGPSGAGLPIQPSAKSSTECGGSLTTLFVCRSKPPCPALCRLSPKLPSNAPTRPSVRLRASRFLVTSADRFHEIDRLRAGIRVVSGNFQEEDDYPFRPVLQGKPAPERAGTVVLPKWPEMAPNGRKCSEMVGE